MGSSTHAVFAYPSRYDNCTSITATGKFLTVPSTSLTYFFAPVSFSAVTRLEHTTTVLHPVSPRTSTFPVIHSTYHLHQLQQLSLLHFIGGLFLSSSFSLTVCRNKRLYVTAGPAFVVPFSIRNYAMTVGSGSPSLSNRKHLILSLLHMPCCVPCPRLSQRSVCSATSPCLTVIGLAKLIREIGHLFHRLGFPFSKKKTSSCSLQYPQTFL